jgi:hypothetical protein
MKQSEADEIAKYIESLKDPEKFLEYCKKYHEGEPRDIAYVVARNIVDRGQLNDSFVLAAAKIIIITWNIAGFQRLLHEDKLKLDNEILESFRNSKQELEKLKDKRLENLDLNNPEIVASIEKIFNEFSSKKSIKYTGASKILHIINPSVFMMWDNNIRNAYHKLHIGTHKSNEYAKCYIEFLKKSQEIIKSLLQKKNEGDFWNVHLSFMDEDFVRSFSFKETMLKMLDECNYWIFTKSNSKIGRSQNDY